MTKRYWEIDFLRGTSILLVILIHSTVYFFSNPIARNIWNVSQISVPIFIFCSLYIFVTKEWDKDQSWLSYIYKRTKRLLIPYFLFIPCFFLLLFFIRPEQLSTNYILQSLIVIGGIDINWLILLFIELTFLLSLLKVTKQKIVLLLFLSCLSFLSSLFFVFYPTSPSINYKYVMWLPWSLLLGFTYLFVLFQEKKSYLAILGGISFFVFLSLIFILQSSNHSLIFRENKYPPNLYYLSFGMASIIVMYFLAPLFTWMSKPLTYLSNNSYQLYFIHYFFLIWFASNKQLLALPWWIFFLLILGISLMTLIIGNLLLRWFKKN